MMTAWFRDRAIWPIVGDHLASLGRPVRIWCGGSGDGREAYSASALAKGRGIPGVVIATDSPDRPDLIEKAERGEWLDPDIWSNIRNRHSGLTFMSALRLMSFDARSRVWAVRPGVREGVTFGFHDLGVDVVPKCDVALVRNCWRFLPPERREVLADQLIAALPSDGMLVVGSADLNRYEQSPPFGRWEPVEDITPTAVKARFHQVGHEMLWRPKGWYPPHPHPPYPPYPRVGLGGCARQA